MKLFLHFDVNETICNAAPVNGKTDDYIFQCQLSKMPEYAFSWRKKLPAMPYHEYVYRYLYPNMYQARAYFEKKCRIDIEGFVKTCKKLRHPYAYEINQQYTKAKEVHSSQKTKLLPSFYALLEHLAQLKQTGQIEDYQIFIRTFGKELPIVAQDLKEHTKLEFVDATSFNDGVMMTPGDEGVIQNISGVNEIYSYWKKTGKHFLIQDDLKFWNTKRDIDGKEMRKHWRFSKPFPFDSESSDEISIFFDDSINTDRESKTNIIAPYDVNKKKYIPIEEVLQSGNAYVSSPIQATCDVNYFIEKVEATRLKHHLRNCLANILNQYPLMQKDFELTDKITQGKRRTADQIAIDEARAYLKDRSYLKLC